MVPLSHCLMVSVLLFGLGVIGVLTRRNVILILMSIELMLNAANLVFVAASRTVAYNMDGHVFAFMVMTVAAAEAAVGLAIVVAIFRNKLTVNVDEINLMKW